MSLKTTRLSLITVLVILTLAVQPVAAAPSRTYGYVVQLGDTLASISRKFGVSPDVILDVNGLRKRPDLIYVGETLTLPIDMGYTPSYTGPFFYTVQAGDTVQTLNNRFAIDRFTLRQVNKLAPDANVLTPGTTLLVPAGPHRYTVQSGNTIQAIAAMFGTTVNNILRFNAHLGNGAFLAPGQEVFIPIIYNVNATPLPAGAVSGNPVGGGSSPQTGTGSSPSVAANASVVSGFQTITLPQNVVNLNGDFVVRWVQLRRARHDASRDNGATYTVAVQFKGGNGTVSVQQYVTVDGQLRLVGLPVTGIYVNPTGGELWNDIEVDIPGTCPASNKTALLLTSGNAKQTVNIDVWTECS
jgi:LysM repeat protein